MRKNIRKGFKLNKKSIVGKVGWCDDKSFPDVSTTDGHYVYIRKLYKNGYCAVSTITSLESKDHKIKFGKMNQLKNGNIYPIPKDDSNFTRWSGVNKNVHLVKLSDISSIGKRHFKHRHHFMIGKNK